MTMNARDTEGNVVSYAFMEKLKQVDERLLAANEDKSDQARSPTTPLALGVSGPHDTDMEARIAVLEEIARSTEKLLEKMDARMIRIEDRQSRDLRWLIGLGLGATALVLGVMAKGFHWL